MTGREEQEWKGSFIRLVRPPIMCGSETAAKRQEAVLKVVKLKMSFNGSD